MNRDYLRQGAGHSARPKAARPITGKTFLIVVEGEVTEPVYLHTLQEKLQLSSAQIIVVPSGGASNPTLLVEHAVKEKKAYEKMVRQNPGANSRPKTIDELWVVCDTDAATRDGHLAEMMKSARTHKVRIAHTTPCFEFWLHLHLAYSTAHLPDGREASKRLAEVIKSAGIPVEYGKDRDAAEKLMPALMPLVPTAVAHAERVRADHARTGNTSPATEMDRLVRELNAAASPANAMKLAASTDKQPERSRPRR